MSTFHVIDGTVAQDVITSAPSEILEIVRDTYLQHSRGATVNPDSYFLRFPDNPGARIIALPAHLGGEAPVSGLKWIASYPENVRQNLPRASAVLLLNDAETGYPFACLEASRISAARTAASAALAVETLAPDEAPRTVLFVGAGIIGRTVSDFLAARGLNVRECLVHDHVEAYAEKFAAYATDTHGWQARAVSEIDDALATADLVVLATTAPAPWLADGQTLLPDQLILNLSLRDIHPTVMVKCHNIVDDIDHCLKAQTSPPHRDGVRHPRLHRRHPRRRPARHGHPRPRPPHRLLAVRPRRPGPGGRLPHLPHRPGRRPHHRSAQLLPRVDPLVN